MNLRRGFKAQANRIAIGIRSDLALHPHAPLEIDQLAKKLDVPIVPLSDFQAECGEAVRQLYNLDASAFSAVTLPRGSRGRFILHNDSHSRSRQRSNIAHEFAHILLNHPMTLPLDTTGCRIVDKDIEDEANWLAGVLLIPDVAALRILKEELNDDDACSRYGVSKVMLRFRLNASGARIRLSRWRR